MWGREFSWIGSSVEEVDKFYFTRFFQIAIVEMSSRLRAIGGSPLVKTVFQAKRKLTPLVGPEDTSDWSNSAQSTLGIYIILGSAAAFY